MTTTLCDLILFFYIKKYFQIVQSKDHLLRDKVEIFVV